MDPTDFSNVLKSSENCVQYPSVCWTLIAIHNLGVVVISTGLFILALILVFCGLVFGLWKLLVKFYPKTARRLIPKCIRPVASLRALNYSASLNRLLTEMEESLKIAGDSIDMDEIEWSIIEEKWLNVDVGLNVNENIALGINENQVPESKTEVVEIPPEIGDVLKLEADIALGTDTKNKAPNQVNAEVKPNDTVAPKSPRVGTNKASKVNANGPSKRVPLYLRNKSPTKNNR